MDFALTKIEWIFLIAAVAVTLPMLFFLRRIFIELRGEDAAREAEQPGPPRK